MKSRFYQRILTVTALIGGLGVIIGAFGAHFLKTRLAVQDLETIKTGIFYLFIHVLATLVVYQLGRTSEPDLWLKGASIGFLIGIVLFSGSLFLISTSSLTGLSPSIVGPITPIGGLCLIMGWVCLMLHSFRSDY
jgi:uncharacterized membrane protein YgdD (TMEM256/DUF423 family)